ncbi:tyrosine-type recombinase/integrase [Vulcanococcus sp.]|uniref:tyrosine-type recombinase/integrase n=1 Tax=Vulcanococcus sp. TaxID=2856995 RepID=UPI0037D9CB89
MAKGRFSNDLPQSGLPGLRFRRDTQMWVVSLPVPTSLRATLRNARGKPLTRLERSTGERNEGRARRAYPKLLAELEAELQQKSKDAGLNTTIQEAVERAIGKIYEEVVSDEQSLRSVTSIGRQLKTKGGNPSPHSAPKNRLKIKPVESIEGATTQRAAQMSRLLAGELLRRQGLSLSGPELELAERSLKWAITEAGKYGEQIQEIGYLAKETEAGKSLREAANKAKPISIWEVAEHKFQWSSLSESAIQAHQYALRAWTRIIKKTSLEDINTQNLNQFLEHLVTQGWNGKPLCPDSANGMATTIASLIKHQSLQDGLERTKPIYRKIKTDKRTAKLRQRDKATKKEDVKKALDYAYLHEKDRYRWLWLLLIDNTTLRVSESLSLKWKDLAEIDGAWFFDLQFSKTAEGIRYVPLNDRLEKWLLPKKGGGEEYVINNSWNQTKSPKDGAGNWTRSLEKKLNLEGRINPHAFRHGAGGDLAYELPEGLKKKLMGHAGGMTDHYTREDLKKLREASNYIGTDWKPPETNSYL